MTLLAEPPADVHLTGNLPPLAPGRDGQIETLRRLLASRPRTALSLDCFDTVLWRAVPKPTDVFLLLGQRLEDLGLLRPKLSPALFMKMRVLAEGVARAQASATANSPEVGLADIYSMAGWRRYTSLSGPELCRHELLTEAAATSADPWMQRFLAELLGQDGAPTVFVVSDTYLDAASLRFLLRSAGLGLLAGVPIFSSCEHGVDKASGLLRVAMESMGVEPADCIHVGNSLQSDVRPAVQAGCATIHVPERSPIAERALASEGSLPAGTESAGTLDAHFGDSGLSALRGRIARHRPASVPGGEAIFWDAGATTLGPVFTGFAEWVHERAGELGIETALCLMREGKFLAELLNAVPAARATCSPVPFWASREACLRATFFNASQAELRRVLWRVDPPTPRSILETVGLLPSDIPGGDQVVTAAEKLGTPSDVASAFIEFLAGKNELRERIVERSAAKRKQFAKHLLGSLVGNGGTVALVDLGFGATIQEYLHNIVHAEGLAVDFRGLYLFTSPRALIRQLNGHVVEGFLADAGAARERITTLDRSPEILEVIMTSSDGSLLEIGPDGSPLLAQRGPEREQDQRRLLVQDGIRAFQQEWNFWQRHNTLGCHKPLSRSTDALHRILIRFIGKPGTELAGAFGNWSFDDNLGSAHRASLVPEVLRHSAGYIAPEHLVLTKVPDLYWVGGAAAATGLEDEVAWLQGGQAALGSFVHQHGGGDLHLAFNAPGERTQVRATMPIVFSKTGRNKIAWSGTVHSGDAVLSTSGTQAVLRLDRVTIARQDGTVEDFDWRGEARSSPSGIRVAADAPVAEGVALVSDTRTLRLGLRHQPNNPVTGIEVLYGALLAS